MKKKERKNCLFKRKTNFWSLPGAELNKKKKKKGTDRRTEPGPVGPPIEFRWLDVVTLFLVFNSR